MIPRNCVINKSIFILIVTVISFTTVTVALIGKEDARDIFETAQKTFNEAWAHSFLLTSITANNYAVSLNENRTKPEKIDAIYNEAELRLQNLKNMADLEYKNLRNFFYEKVDKSDLSLESKKDLKNNIKTIMIEYRNSTTGRYEADLGMLWSIKQECTGKSVKRRTRVNVEAMRGVAQRINFREERPRGGPLSVLEFDPELVNHVRKDIEELWHSFHGYREFKKFNK